MFEELKSALAPAAKSLTGALSQAWRERTPRQLRRSLNLLYLAPPIANTLEVDRVHAVINSARDGEVQDLFTLYREIEVADNVVQSAIMTRKLAVLNEPWSILPFDKSRPEDVAAAEFIKQWLSEFDGFIDSCGHLLSASMWPVALVEKKFEPCGSGYKLGALRPVPPELFDYRARVLRIKETGSDGDPLDVTSLTSR